MITNLQKLGVDTSEEKGMSLAYSDDVRKNYQSLFRLLRRLTADYTFERQEFVELLSRMRRWQSTLPLTGKYRIPSHADSQTLKSSIGFSDKMTEEQIVMNDSCAVILYNGSAFRSQHVWSGNFKRPLTLPSGAKISSVLLISKPAAILLNWSLKGSSPETFDLLANYMVHKMDQRYTHVHKASLSRVFHHFYVDYLAQYSVTLQEREYEAMRQGSVATAYRTKKNIPTHVEERMTATTLLQHFDFVELDETVDLELFDRLEQEVSYLTDALPTILNFKVSALRLRKLGKHSSTRQTTTGLYYPSLDNIVVELCNVSSFVHEWGHAFDNHMEVLSGQKAFLEQIYSPAVSYIANHITDKKFQSYYSMPSEVFARAFEWYVSRTYNGTIGILKSHNDYATRPEYMCFDDISESVIRYFDRANHI